MTSFKFLIVFFALLALAGIPGRGASDGDNASAETGAPPTTTSTTHHRKHHAASSATSSTNSATATSSNAAGTSPKTKSIKAGKAEANSGKTSSSEAKTPSGAKSENATGTSTGKTLNGASATTSTSSVSHHLKKHHAASTSTASGSETPSTTDTKPREETSSAKSETTKSSAKSATENVTGTKAPETPAPSLGAAAAAATAVNSQTAVAAPGKGRHHRHGKGTDAASTTKLPEPPIIISTTAVPPLPPVSPLPLGLPPSPGSLIPTVQTGLPVARPGAGTTATLPLAMIRNPAPISHFPFVDYPAPKTHSYPWKRGIVTTVFWIGEGSTPMSSMTNKMSAWDMNWVHDNGGADDQYDMSGYASGSHASLINPFYVALPFNDLAYPDKTQRWLPPGWYKPAHHGEKQQSSCQGRWIEIKTRKGVSCFAQWEDVGPIGTDDAEYVFGSAPPTASRGLDVSPAVAKYLGFDSAAVTSWRFVDDDDVPPGLWLRYNEQAILFQALKEQSRRSTPIQDLAQPIPDGADDNHSQKEIRAGRG